MIDQDLDKEFMGMRRLWRSVIIQVMRDACGSSQGAYNALIWARSSDGATVCDMAGVDISSTGLFFERLASSHKDQDDLARKLLCSKPKKFSRQLQEDLFTDTISY